MPGTIQRPRASIWLAPDGTATAPRGPAAAMRPASTTTIASATGGPPLPSMSVPPTMAIVGAVGCAAACAASRIEMARILFTTRDPNVFARIAPPNVHRRDRVVGTRTPPPVDRRSDDDGR